MIPDVCTQDQVPRAMGMVYSTWGFALIAGPAASGLLAHPERTFPAALVPADSVFVQVRIEERKAIPTTA